MSRRFRIFEITFNMSDACIWLELNFNECQVIIQSNTIGVFQKSFFKPVHVKRRLRIVLQMNNFDQAADPEHLSVGIFDFNSPVAEK